MGYHDRCFDDIPYLESKDPYHINRRDRLTESAIKRYAETNPEYQKVLDKYYKPEKKSLRSTITTKETTVKTSNKVTSKTEVPMCGDSKNSIVSDCSEICCPNCKQKFNPSKKNVTVSKVTKKDDNSNLTYWKAKIDDNHPPTFPPRYPKECTSLILPAMFTDEERKYYQSKQPKYPPAEKVSSI